MPEHRKAVMQRQRGLLGGFFLLLVSIYAGAPPGQAALLHTTLDNGLTVVIEENHANPVVALWVFVRTGSVYEQEYLGSGISHFFEHVIHGGTTHTRSEDASRRLLEAIGNNANAYTTADHTAYHINTSTEHWRTALELLGDWMLNSSITPEEFEREKGVVQRELEQGLDDPGQVLTQIALEARFKIHPGRYPVIGYKELVQKVTREDLLTYYQRMYTPNNMTLVVVGDIDSATVFEHTQHVFGNGQRRPLPAVSLPEEPPQLSKRVTIKDMPISQTHMSLSFRTVPLAHPDLYPLDLLAYILANGNSSRLVRRIQEDQRLVYQIQSASHTPPYVDGTLAVWATLEPERLEAATEAILQEMSRLRDELVGPQELAKAKKQKIADYIVERQTVEERARALGLNVLGTADPNFSDLYTQKIQNVTAEDIRDAARRYIREETLVHAIVRPKSPEEDEVAAATTAIVGPVVKKVLANGLTLLLRRNPALPVVAMQAYVKAGVRAETPETHGLSQLTASLLTRGTTTRSAEAIATIFDLIGGTITAEGGNNSFFVNATCLRDDFPQALDVYADVLLHPSFPETELDKVRQLMLAQLDQQDDDWRAEAERLFRETFFTVHPYRLPLGGNPITLQRFLRQDVVTFYRNYVVPQNMVLAIFGDIDVDRTTTAVERLFAEATSRPVRMPEIVAEPAPTAPRRLVKQTQKQVGAIYMGFPGTTMANQEDRYPLHILDGLLSGLDVPGGWLHNELRGKQLVYVVHAFNWLGLEPGYFGIYAATQPEKVDEVVAIILRNIEKAKAGEISDEEITRTKQMAIVTALLRRQSNEQTASDAALHELYGLGYDLHTYEQERLNKVTKADVQRVAQTYLTYPTIIITTPNSQQR